MISIVLGISTVLELTFYVILGSCALTPYIKQHGSKLNHRTIRECQETGREPHEIYPAYIPKIKLPHFVEIKRFSKFVKKVGLGENIIHGHYAVVSDPLRTISVLEPMRKGGCDLNMRQTVLESAKQKMCEVAINAGYFNTTTGNCLGNVVSDGHVAHNSNGIQNAHFGLMKDGTLFTGYVPEEFILNDSKFQQLVGGVMWVVRNGTDYLNTSKNFECEDTEETGTLNKFVDVVSSRTAIGHDDDGRVIIVQVEGKTDHYGISLWDMQSLLKEMGLRNAINLDGGGSSTFVVNGTVVNYPSDECIDKRYICERKVSTIICIHPPYCDPPDCHGHGNCVNGNCLCEKNWLPPSCDKLQCENNCSSQGICTENGCQCLAGYYGEDCSKRDCKNICSCLNGRICNSKTGSFNCELEFLDSTCHNVETCMEKLLTKQHMLDKNCDDKWKFHFYGTIIIAVVVFIFIIGLFFIFYSCSCHFRSQQRFCKKHKRHRYLDLQRLTALSDSSESDNMPTNSNNKK